MRTLLNYAWIAVVCGFSLLPCAAFAQKNAYQEALEKYQSKQYQEALPAAEQAVHEDGENAAYRHIYGLILAALRQPGPAEENLRKAVALAPDQPAFQFDLGYLLHQQRKYAEAAPVLKQAVALDPDNLMARFMLARSYVFSYHELQNPNFSELTLEQLNYIVKKNPSFPAVHHHLALVYINNGESAKALDELKTELRFYPNNIQARMELGETLIKLNQYHNAVEELLIAAKQAPQMPGIQFALAKAYKTDGQTAKALEAAKRCVDMDGQFADGHYLLGQLYRDTNQPELAKQQFELFRQIKGRNAPSP